MYISVFLVVEVGFLEGRWRVFGDLGDIVVYF